MISKLRSNGTAVFLARKDNGTYVVQSHSFTTRVKAHAFAARLVTSKLVDKYFITTASRRIVSESADEGDLSKSHPVEILQSQNKPEIDTPQETAERDTSKLYALLETEPDKVEEFAGAILEINPGDPVALKALAWYHFRNDRFEEAYKYFSELNRIEPEQVDHVSGMIYALSGMKEFEKAMELAPAVNLFFYKRLPDSRE